MLENQNIRMFLQKVTLLVIKKVNTTVPWKYVINDLNREEIFGTFYENELQKTNQKEFRVENVSKRKGDKL